MAEENTATMEVKDSSQKPKQQRQQLSKAMEHMRLAVTIEPTPKPSQEEDAYGVPASFQPVRKEPHRSHDPENNQKRSDPFQFGSRYLEEGDNIFEFNAWDHVETDDAYKEFSEMQYAKQKESPVSDFDKRRFNAQPAKWWDMFYKSNTTNFFKNRKWLAQEFPILTDLTKSDSPPALLLEVGAGAGNTAFPILALNNNPNLKLHACDFSKKAVELIRSNEAYDEKHIQADVWDISGKDLPPGITEGSVDVVLMIFIFSALAPSEWQQAVQNIWRILKPGGRVLFRDYGRGDLAQVRFKKGRWMEENFYIRGDGTRVYFFEKDELDSIWTGKHLNPAPEDPAKTLESDPTHESVEEEKPPSSLEEASQPSPNSLPKPESGAPAVSAFKTVHIGVDRRMLVNRQRKLKMYRCWMQAVFEKPENILPA